MNKRNRIALIAVIVLICIITTVVLVSCKEANQPRLTIAVSKDADISVGDDLEKVKQYLTVRYESGQNNSFVVTDYQILGTLSYGQVTLTVKYNGLVAQFNIFVNKGTNQDDVDNDVIHSNGYSLKINSNGGSINGDFVLNEDGSVTPPAVTPTRDNYIFDGWFKDEDCTIAWNFENDKLTVDIIVEIYIKWKPQSGGEGMVGKPTVTVDTNGGTFNDSIVVNDDYSLAEPSIVPTKSDSKFGGWYKDKDCTIRWNFANDKIEGNITIYIKWIRLYDVSFQTNGGSAIASVEADERTTILKPQDPKKDNNVFVGWFTDSKYTVEWHFDTDVVLSDMTLYAKWNPLVSVNFQSNGGSAIASIENIQNGSLINEPETPSRKDYNFGGWYSDSTFQNAWDFATDKIDGDTVLYAKWIPLYTVVFESNGGSQVDSIVVEYGSVITAPVTPIREGLVFEYWCKDSMLYYPWDFSTDTVTKNTKLFARWRDPVGGTDGLNYSYNYSGNSYTVTGISNNSETEIVIPSLYMGLPVTHIKENAFLNCIYISSVTFSKSIRAIGASAFSGCSALSHIEFCGDTGIGTSAFKDCTALKDVDLSKCASIGEGAFSGCSNLQNITVKSYFSGFPRPFGHLFGKENYSNSISAKQCYDDNNGNSVNVTYYIPADLKNVTLICSQVPDNFFYRCSTIEKVELVGNVETIGSGAFEECSGLKNVIIPSSVKTIKSYAFEGCRSLTDIELPSGITAIGKSAFYHCDSLVSLEIPEYVTIINDSLLRYCGKLTSVTIGSNVTIIDSFAFASSGSLKSITFRGTVEQWNKINKSGYWKNLSSLKKIICSNGEITL